MTRPAPPRLDAEIATAVRRIFDDAGYTAEQISVRLGTDDRSLAQGPERPVHLRRIGEDDPLAVLVRMLILDVPVARDVVDRVLGHEAVSLLERVGLVVVVDGSVDGTVRVVPHEHLLIASDRYAGDHKDHVAAVHGPSALLAHLTGRRPVARMLDMGTGNGIQTLLAAPHAQHIVSTDINERALAFAAFNAALNGVENVEFRAGSFFEPVTDEVFDLVVTNPPYVISPESAFLFRDSGLPGDSLSETVVRALPRHLSEGAFATAMISWIHQGDDPTARPTSWLVGSGCDVLAIHTTSDDPLTVASQWNRDARPDPAEYGAAVDRWVDYFRSQGIEMIAFGCVILRRRTPGPGETNWVRSTVMPRRRLEPAGSHLERIFAAHDHIAGLADARELLDRRFRVHDNAVLENRLSLADGGWSMRESSLVLSAGLRYAAELDEVTTALVLALDGSRTLREALPPPDDTRSQTELEQIGVTVARRMFEVGFLELA